ncbi:hypothetical protein GLOTRDRAFT_134250 [Gloeophyllum trabeum ATCC 11539]|uniref:Uncharacterized protein n=1 Tax=Gloeophyllum trabeum (strain ATCC 11539 / FP-39264 / Madison 617) TaxID=670483 RepID=S7PRU8_GLOTA|nr:uncharacterized protein GLOTRDRAFT_134250 [Gloeophyllum trabeum ATCC 11539]EPQ50103.1 hypothetical protein GLOTRDRAFT_134250 [Gloeophyllum trabeum ATCC 11539]
MVMPQLEHAYVQVHNFAYLEEIVACMHGVIDGIGSTQVLCGCTMYNPSPTSICCMLTPDLTTTTWQSQTAGLCLVFEGYDYDEEAWILDVLRPRLQPYLSTVERLTIEDGRAYVEQSVMAWRQLFSLMPGVTELCVSGRYTSALPAGLYALDRSGEPTNPLFPKLESLRLESVWFRDPWRRILSVVDFLDRVLKPYQGLDCPNTHIRLTITAGINISATDIEVLRDIFEVVKWDSLEKNDVSHEDDVQWYVFPGDDAGGKREKGADESDYDADDEDDDREARRGIHWDADGEGNGDDSASEAPEEGAASEN